MDGILIDPKPAEDDAMSKWIQAIYKIGVPSVIALYLVWSLVNGGLTLLANIDQAQRAHIMDAANQTAILNDIRNILIRSEEYQRRMACLSIARTQNDRDICAAVR